MNDRRPKVLAVASHPVQYMAPHFRRIAADGRMDLHVAYCSLRGAQAGMDPDFGAEIAWDVPLLEGYLWSEVPNRGSGKESFFGLRNPGLRQLIRDGSFDAVLCYVGYVRASFWIAQRAAKSSGTAFLFGTDAHSLVARDGKAWKIGLKKILWPWLFRQADQVIVPSTGTYELIASLGISPKRITLTPYSVDNDWWKSESAKVDRAKIRAEWGVAPDQPAILFCAKLQPWKRPLDLLRAFAMAKLGSARLIYAGEGPQRELLEAEATALGVAAQVKFLGFVNQSTLPALYTAADLMVLPSSYEPFAVVVNEAICCGCPVVVSNEVGAARDLVAPVRREFVFPAGDVKALAGTLQLAFSDPAELKETARRGLQLVEEHSPQKMLAATEHAIRSAMKNALR